jgi:hypothetical protein
VNVGDELQKKIGIDISTWPSPDVAHIQMTRMGSSHCILLVQMDVYEPHVNMYLLGCNRFEPMGHNIHIENLGSNRVRTRAGTGRRVSAGTLVLRDSSELFKRWRRGPPTLGLEPGSGLTQIRVILRNFDRKFGDLGSKLPAGGIDSGRSGSYIPKR